MGSVFDSFRPVGQNGGRVTTVTTLSNIMDSLRSLVRVRPISEKCTVQVISILSMVTCLATIITYLIILRDPQAWEGVADYVLHWMVDNNLDVTATRKVVAAIRLISANSVLVMGSFLLLSFLFPVVSGLVLGLSILVWRLVFTVYRSQR